MSTAPGVYKHNKTGNLYVVTGTRINASNGEQNGQKMVEYESLKKNDEKYVRDEAEFNEKQHETVECLIHGCTCEGGPRPRFEYVSGPRKERK